MTAIRVLLAEDQEIVQRGLKLLLRTQSDMEVVGEAENGQQAIAAIASLIKKDKQPAVVLRIVLRVVLRIVLRVVLRVALMNVKALIHGAKGYLLKDTSLEDLTDVIRCIAKSYTQFGLSILEKVVSKTARSEPEKAPPAELTTLSDKGKEVLGLLAKGYNNKEIATTLFIFEGTVRNHVMHILGRLNVRDRTQAAIAATSCLAYLKGKSQ